jgi:hypothetical protein
LDGALKSGFSKKVIFWTLENFLSIVLKDIHIAGAVGYVSNHHVSRVILMPCIWIRLIQNTLGFNFKALNECLKCPLSIYEFISLIKGNQRIIRDWFVFVSRWISCLLDFPRESLTAPNQ